MIISENILESDLLNKKITDRDSLIADVISLVKIEEIVAYFEENKNDGVFKNKIEFLINDMNDKSSFKYLNLDIDEFLQTYKDNSKMHYLKDIYLAVFVLDSNLTEGTKIIYMTSLHDTSIDYFILNPATCYFNSLQYKMRYSNMLEADDKLKDTNPDFFSKWKKFLKESKESEIKFNNFKDTFDFILKKDGIELDNNSYFAEPMFKHVLPEI